MVDFCDLSAEQWEALRRVKAWFEAETNEPFLLGGLAGTGKTALLPLIPQYLGLKGTDVLYVAPTNQAVKVVAEKLDAVGFLAKVRTLHSTLKTAKEFHCQACPLYSDLRSKCHVTGNDNTCGCDLVFSTKEIYDTYDMIICDESSMVTEELYDDLTTLPGRTKILFVGDHGQLPPVGSTGFDLMANPTFALTEPQRQVADSPIIQLSRLARDTGFIPYGDFGPGVFKSTLAEADFSTFEPETTMMISMFKDEKYDTSTLRLNRMWREGQGLTGAPKVGDRVRAVRVSRKNRVPKGTIGTITSIKLAGSMSYKAKIVVPDRDEPYESEISIEQFDTADEIIGLKHVDLWEYGYCITCNKAQGSEFESVIVFEPPTYFRTNPRYNYSRWLYTAITRAKKQLAIIAG